MNYPSAKKKYGQNFLIDQNILNKIILLSESDKSDVIEIGPGTGLLTEKLLAKSNSVHAFEIDLDMVSYLNQFLKNDKLILNHLDILKADLNDYIKSNNLKNVIVVANLPYYISTKIIFMLLEVEKIVSINIMLQKELIERITSKKDNKTFGRLTVSINSFFNVENYFIVGRNSFKPSPNVDSGFIKLKKLDILIENHHTYMDFVKLSFSNRRKQLLNNLKTNQIFYNFTKEYLTKNNYSIYSRPENVSVDGYKEIWRNIIKNENEN